MLCAFDRHARVLADSEHHRLVHDVVHWCDLRILRCQLGEVGRRPELARPSQAKPHHIACDANSYALKRGKEQMHMLASVRKTPLAHRANRTCYL